MADGSMNRVIDHLRRAVVRNGEDRTDRDLLGTFIERRDETAIAALIERHGPMVWGVCRRLLSHHDAEDAFQATFLVLVRKSASITPRDMVGNWLYGVAHRAALQARRTAARRMAREVQVAAMSDAVPEQRDQWLDVQPLLDQELSRLPAKYRVVIVLCDLEGRTRKEAARQLVCPEGTVAGRLARARAMLARRLTRRGVTLSGAALAAVLTQNAASGGVPASVVASTVITVGGGTISVKVAVLTKGVMKAMLLTRLKVALLLVALGMLMAAGTLPRWTAAAPPRSERDDGLTKEIDVNPAPVDEERAKREAEEEGAKREAEKREAAEANGADEARDEAGEAARPELHGPEKQGLAAFVLVPRHKVKLGEAIPVFFGVMALDNVKGGAIKITPARLPTGENNFSWFSVAGPDGKACPYFGPAVSWPLPERSVALHRSEVYGGYCSNLCGYHKIDKPGTYRIEWHYQSESFRGDVYGGRLNSNKVQFEVVRDPRRVNDAREKKDVTVPEKEAKETTKSVDDLDKENQAVEAVLRHGGEVTRDKEKPGMPVVAVSFNSPKAALLPRVTDEQLKLLIPLKNLTSLDLEGTNVTDAGLKELATLKQLTAINLRFTRVSDAGLKELVPLTKLAQLALSGTRITDAGLKEIGRLKEMTNLDLGDTRVTDEGLKELGHLRGLTRLVLYKTAVTGKGLSELAQLAKLTTLFLQQTKVTDRDLQELAPLKSLVTLNLDQTQVTDTGLKELVSLKKLTSLSFYYTKVTDAGLKDLAALTSLSYLSLTHTGVTDDGLKYLANLKSLTTLDFSDTKVTAEGAAKLRKALPSCKIYQGVTPQPRS